MCLGASLSVKVLPFSEEIKFLFSWVYSILKGDCVYVLRGGAGRGGVRKGTGLGVQGGKGGRKAPLQIKMNGVLISSVSAAWAGGATC